MSNPPNHLHVIPRNSYCGDGSKIILFPWPRQQLQYKNFLPFLSKFVYSKLFELYLIFHHVTIMAEETEEFISVTMVVPWYYLQMIWWTMYPNYVLVLYITYMSHLFLQNLRPSGLWDQNNKYAIPFLHMYILDT